MERGWWPAIVMALMLPVAGSGQEVEWVARIPRIGRIVYPVLPTVDTVRGIVYVSKSRPSAEFRSTDGGRTWRGGQTPELEDMVVFRWSNIVTADGGLLANGGYAGSQDWGSFRSVDSGRTWAPLPADPRMGVPDGRIYVRTVVPPTTLIAAIADDAEYQTTDLGRTWTAINDLRLRTDVPRPSFVPMPDVWAIAGDSVWWRRNVRSETVMTPTDLPLSIATWVESDVGGVAALSWYDKAVLVRTAPGAPFVKLDRVLDPRSGVEIPFTPTDLVAVDDSTALCAAENGIVLRVDLHRAILSLVVDAGWVLGSPSSQYVRSHLAYGNTLLLEYSDTVRIGRRPTRMRVAIDRRDLSASCRRTVRRSVAMIKGLASEALVGEHSIVVVAEDLDWADVLLSDDLGTTWWFPDRIDIEDGAAPIVGIRRSVRDAAGGLWMQSDRDQLITGRGERFQEVRYPATDAMDWGLTGTNRELWLGFVEHRRPTILVDRGRLLRMDDVVGTVEDVTGDIVDTLVPEPVSFFHVLDDGRYVAGRTNLWLGDGMHHWERREITVAPAPSVPRGSISDVVRTVSGDLVAALRGWSFADSLGNAHTARWGGLVRSTDDGITWQVVDSWPAEHPFVTRLARTTDGALLAWATAVVVDTIDLDQRTGSVRPLLQGGGIYRSGDGGVSWDPVYGDRTNRLRHPNTEPDLLQHPSGILFSTTYTGLLVRSADDGRTWAIDDPPDIGAATISAVDAEIDGALRLSTSHGVCRYRASGTVSVRRSNGRPAEYAMVLGAQRQLTVTTTTTTIASVTITDIAGRRIGWWEGHGSTVVIDGAAWLPGLYVVTIDDGSAPYTGTVFVW